MSTENLEELKKRNAAKNREYKRLDSNSLEKKEKFEKRIEHAPKTLLEKAEEDKEGIERRLEDNDKKLNELLFFGNELVTNVKIANEKRELLRRNYEAIRKQDLLGDLEKESTEALARFNEITSKWSELKTIKEPMGLFEELEEQKVRISNLMKQKDDLIEQCQRELNRVDDKYYMDQEKQSTDTTCLVERIDNQIELIKNTYDQHLELLENTIDEERINIGMVATQKWEELYEKLNSSVTGKYDLEIEKDAFYNAEIERITRDQEEITRATRIRLERDAENLQLELRNTKNNVLMNSEKLDYNYQILKKRNEENGIINNQQKRRVAKLHETISGLKRKIRESKINSEITIKKLSKEVVGLHANITELETKAEQFRNNNAKKYQNVWDVNYQEALTLVNKVMDIDRLLHEQQLGLEWTRPNLPALKKKEAAVAAKKKKAKAKFVAGKGDVVAETRLLRNVLRKISERAIFLIEERLLKILEPFSDVEKCLVRIDNIFGALKISNIEDVKSLNEYFLPYAWCPNCSSGLPPQVMAKLYALEADGDFPGNDDVKLEDIYTKNSSFDTHSVVAASGSTSNSSMSDLANLAIDEAEENVDKMLAGKPAIDAGSVNADEDRHIEIATHESQTSTRCNDHFLVIEPALVLTALKEFTEKHLARNKSSSEFRYDRSVYPLSINETINTEVSFPRTNNRTDVKKFWSEFMLALPENKQNIWKCLEHGLNHYHMELKQRESLDNQCEFLRRQNSELRHLLQKYIRDDDVL